MFNKESKKDFGLYLSAVQNLLAESHRLQQYHEDYHARGDRNRVDTDPLSQPNSSVKSPYKPRKWKPRFKNG